MEMNFDVGPIGAFWAGLRFARSGADPTYPPRELRCRRCGSRDCVKALPIARFDKLRLAAHRTPWDCRKCGHHFYRFDREEAARLLSQLEELHIY